MNPYYLSTSIFRQPFYNTVPNILYPYLPPLPSVPPLPIPMVDTLTFNHTSRTNEKSKNGPREFFNKKKEFVVIEEPEQNPEEGVIYGTTLTDDDERNRSFWTDMYSKGSSKTISCVLQGQDGTITYASCNGCYICPVENCSFTLQNND